MVEKFKFLFITIKTLKASRPSRTKAGENFPVALFFLYNRHLLRQRKKLQRIAEPLFLNNRNEVSVGFLCLILEAEYFFMYLGKSKNLGGCKPVVVTPDMCPNTTESQLFSATRCPVKPTEFYCSSCFSFQRLLLLSSFQCLIF